MERRVLATLLALCTVLAILPGTALAAEDYGPASDISTLNGHLYRVYTKQVSPIEAEAYCKSLGGHLITITSQEEQDFAVTLAVKAGIDGFTIGATDRDQEGVWTWMTGEPWEYTNWSTVSEPNNGLGRGEDYCYSSKSRDWQWIDYYGGYDNFTSKQGFICEWDHNDEVIITFNPNGGSVTPKTKTYQKYAKLGTLPTPVRTGYVFSGWYTRKTGGEKVTASTPATANGTLYAHWAVKPAVCTVTFNPNGGFCSKTTQKFHTDQAYKYLPTATRTGYTFSGWYTAKSGGKKVTASTKATANATLYAHWTKAKRTYQVAFNANGGDVLLENKSVVRGSAYQALPTPTRPGYHFTGWYTKASGGVKITDKTKVNLTANQTLYAHWSTAAVKAASTKSGNWRISVPLYYNVMLYSSNVSASPAAYISEKSSAQTLVCTRMAVLSNGTTRYYTKQNGTYYWFTYTCEMDVN